MKRMKQGKSAKEKKSAVQKAVDDSMGAAVLQDGNIPLSEPETKVSHSNPAPDSSPENTEVENSEVQSLDRPGGDLSVAQAGTQLVEGTPKGPDEDPHAIRGTKGPVGALRKRQLKKDCRIDMTTADNGVKGAPSALFP